MNKINILKITIASFVLIGLITFVGVGYFYRTINSPAAILTEDVALNLLQNNLLGGECIQGGVEYWYSSCTINMAEINNKWEVVIIYDGLKDDSIQSEKIQSSIVYQNGEWFLGQVFESRKCRPGRGHQDFMDANCL